MRLLCVSSRDAACRPRSEPRAVRILADCRAISTREFGHLGSDVTRKKELLEKDPVGSADPTWTLRPRSGHLRIAAGGAQRNPRSQTETHKSRVAAPRTRPSGDGHAATRHGPHDFDFGGCAPAIRVLPLRGAGSLVPWAVPNLTGLVDCRAISTREFGHLGSGLLVALRQKGRILGGAVAFGGKNLGTLELQAQDCVPNGSNISTYHFCPSESRLRRGDGNAKGRQALLRSSQRVLL
jgi:hypothetical protein